MGDYEDNLCLSNSEAELDSETEPDFDHDVVVTSKKQLRRPSSMQRRPNPELVQATNAAVTLDLDDPSALLSTWLGELDSLKVVREQKVTHAWSYENSGVFYANCAAGNGIYPCATNMGSFSMHSNSSRPSPSPSHHSRTAKSNSSSWQNSLEWEQQQQMQEELLALRKYLRDALIENDCPFPVDRYV